MHYLSFMENADPAKQVIVLDRFTPGNGLVNIIKYIAANTDSVFVNHNQGNVHSVNVSKTLSGENDGEQYFYQISMTFDEIKVNKHYAAIAITVRSDTTMFPPDNLENMKSYINEFMKLLKEYPR